MNAQDIAHQVSLTLGDHILDYDIDAIVEEIILNHGHVDIDTIDSDAYWAIVTKHDATQVQLSEGDELTATYTTTDELGIQTITVIRNGDDLREITTTDGEIVDQEVTYAGADADESVEEYLRRRDMELTGEGYTRK